MRFEQVIGQAGIKQQLFRMLDEGRMPHALLFAGPEGCGKLPMALALASRLLCTQPGPDHEPCGTCRGCKMSADLVHPDLHFVFPVFRPSGQSGQPTSDQFLPQWRKQVSETPYFTRQDWIKDIGVENQQTLIGVADANAVLHKLSVATSQGGYRIIIIWHAEQMNQETANKLLKILEEPPAETVFILITDQPDRLLATILSRTQRIDFPPLEASEIAQALETRCGLQPDDALTIARAASGSLTKAFADVTVGGDDAQFFDLFVLFMRLCYQRRVRDLHKWAIDLSAWGRERQKAFLAYAQRMLRENFICNFRLPELNYMSRQEAAFAVRFSPFINERNVIGLMDELSDAQRDIEQNVNARMVFFDLALKTIVLLIK